MQSKSCTHHFQQVMSRAPRLNPTLHFNKHLCINARRSRLRTDLKANLTNVCSLQEQKTIRGGWTEWTHSFKIYSRQRGNITSPLLLPTLSLTSSLHQDINRRQGRTIEALDIKIYYIASLRWQAAKGASSWRSYIRRGFYTSYYNL